MATAAMALLRPRATTVVPSGFIDLSPADRLDGPPQTLADYTSATPLSYQDNHPSGWRVRIRLDRQGRTENGFSCHWRSGEQLKGAVELEPASPGSPPPKRIKSVIVRAYWQSSTVYTGIKLVQSEPGTGFMAKLKPGASTIRAVTEPRGEWHRSELEGGGAGIELWHGGELEDIRREVAGDFPLLGAEHTPSAPEPPPAATSASRQDHQVLPFEFSLPTVSRVNMSCACFSPPANRRTLQQYLRTPPPSLSGADGDTGTVEWIVEALVSFEDPEVTDAAPLVDPPEAQEVLPSFRAAVQAPEGVLDQFGFSSTTPDLIVHRVVFPFEPMDQHAQDLYSAWRPLMAGPWSVAVARYNGLEAEEVTDERSNGEPEVPLFGRDPRDEALGGSNMGPKRQIQSALVAQEGGREAWRSYEKRMAVKSRLGRTHGWLRTETFIPYPAICARHATSFSLLMHISVTLPANASSSSASPPRVVAVDKVVIILSRRTLTRGGRDERPHFSLVELRREEIKLWDDDAAQPLERMATMAPLSSRTSIKNGEIENGRPHLRLEAGGKGKDIRLDVPLQTVSMTPQGKQTVPARDFRLSMRTPNIESEYVLSVTVQPVNQPSFYAARVPIQFIAGDLMEAPAFEAASGPPIVPAPVAAAPGQEDLPAYM